MYSTYTEWHLIEFALSVFIASKMLVYLSLLLKRGRGVKVVSKKQDVEIFSPPSTKTVGAGALRWLAGILEQGHTCA